MRGSLTRCRSRLAGQSGEQAFENTIDVLEHVSIGHTKNPVSHAFERRGSRSIRRDLHVRPMSRAVYFDDDLLLSAHEVDEVGVDWYLPNEFKPTELSIAKSCPKLCLCAR